MNVYKMMSWGIVGGIVLTAFNWINMIQINGKMFSIDGYPILSSFLTGFFLMSITYFIYEEMGFHPFRRPFRRFHSDPPVSNEPQKIKPSDGESNK